jgi:HEAT repeats
VLKRQLLVSLVALAIAAPSQAGLFKKSAKPDPATHVPSLIQILKTDKDERARAAAAGELDEYDAKAFPEILPALMESLTGDASTSVRSKAAESIGKVRPISSAAGYALERAASEDKSFQVKLSAKAALMKYRVLGHLPGVKVEGTLVQSAEPPFAKGSLATSTPGGTILRPTPPPIPVTGTGALPPAAVPTGPEVPPDSVSTTTKPLENQTGEPPLVDAPKAIPTATPKAPVPVIVIPSTPSKDVIIPVPTVPSGGPSLPPKE